MKKEGTGWGITAAVLFAVMTCFALLYAEDSKVPVMTKEQRSELLDPLHVVDFDNSQITSLDAAYQQQRANLVKQRDEDGQVLQKALDKVYKEAGADKAKWDVDSRTVKFVPHQNPPGQATPPAAKQ